MKLNSIGLPGKSAEILASELNVLLANFDILSKFERIALEYSRQTIFRFASKI